MFDCKIMVNNKWQQREAWDDLEYWEPSPQYTSLQKRQISLFFYLFNWFNLLPYALMRHFKQITFLTDTLNFVITLFLVVLSGQKPWFEWRWNVTTSVPFTHKVSSGKIVPKQLIQRKLNGVEPGQAVVLIY